jgi:hypothetical protein
VVLSYDFLAGDQRLGFAALLVEHHGRKPLQRFARFGERPAARIDAGQLLEKADLALIRLQVDRGECKRCLFHCRLLCSAAQR